MAVCFSLCPKERPPNLKSRILTLEIRDKTDSSSDSALKAKGDEHRDSTPVLDGPTLLSFRNLSLDSSSDSAGVEKEQLGALLKAAAASPADEEKVKPIAPQERTFRDVRPDLNLKDLHSSDSDAE
jgi:hypothetical protein